MIVDMRLSFAFADVKNTELEGVTLYQWCTSNNKDIDTACLAYIRGFINGIALGQKLSHLNIIFCFPQELPTIQLKLIILKGMKDNPTLLNMGAGAVLSKSLLDAYRCKDGEDPIDWLN